MICYNCEELVSRSASVCPYCQVSLSDEGINQSLSSTYVRKPLLKTASPDATKITQLKSTSSPLAFGSPSALHGSSLQEINQQKNSLRKESSFIEEEEQETSTRTSPQISYMTSLLSFLLGGALFFFGIAIPMLAKDGVVVLTWRESLWLPFLGSGLVLLSIGYIFLNKVEKPFDLD